MPGGTLTAGGYAARANSREPLSLAFITGRSTNQLSYFPTYSPVDPFHPRKVPEGICGVGGGGGIREPRPERILPAINRKHCTYTPPDGNVHQKMTPQEVFLRGPVREDRELVAVAGPFGIPTAASRIPTVVGGKGRPPRRGRAEFYTSKTSLRSSSPTRHVGTMVIVSPRSFRPS